MSVTPRYSICTMPHAFLKHFGFPLPVTIPPKHHFHLSSGLREQVTVPRDLVVLTQHLQLKLRSVLVLLEL